MPSPLDEIKTELYKMERFEELGYNSVQAIELIEDGVDWHEVEKLRSNGCSPTLAARICAPIGSKRRYM